MPLTPTQKAQARDRAVQAAWLGYNHKAVLHYTQGGNRWEGIANRKNAKRGSYPNYADCSSYATWCLWNGLYLGFQSSDVVNAASWRAGYTGTMLSNGAPVGKLANVLPGDLVLYGRGKPGEHVAIVVAVKSGVPMVISHGSEAGPFYVPYNYRSDVMGIRRYIR
jgi:hypothetical protein